MRVVDPDRPALVERHERELLPVVRDQVQTALQRLDDLLLLGRLTLDEKVQLVTACAGVDRASLRPWWPCWAGPPLASRAKVSPSASAKRRPPGNGAM